MASYYRIVIYFIYMSVLCLNIATCSKHGNITRGKKRVKRRFAALTQGTGGFSDGTSPNLVMSCDINEDGFEQEDALVLNLRFAEDSTNVLQSLKDQQVEIAEQVKEIWKLFKQTHREQAKLFQLQNALREQNAQLTALYTNVLSNKNKLTSSVFLEDPVDIRNRDENPIEEEIDERDHSSLDTVADNDVSRNSSTALKKNDTTAVEPQPWNEDMPLARSVLYGVSDSRSEPEIPAIVGQLLVNDTDAKSDSSECRRCSDNEYCFTAGDAPQCYPCTECSPGNIMTSPCSRYSDITCEDKNECATTERESPCRQSGTQCANTPGGYLCVGGDGSCIDDYYFNRRSSQCEPCSRCISREYVIVPCSKFSDAVCRTEDKEQLSDIWTGALRKPNKILKNVGDLSGGLALPFTDVSRDNQTVVEISKNRRRSRDHSSSSSSLRKEAESTMKLLQHGIVWMEYNMALLHSCRSYVQTSLMISTNVENPSREGAVLGHSRSRYVLNDPSYRPLAGTRIEHSSGDRYKFVSISAVAEIHPKQDFKVDFRSAHNDCVPNPSKSDPYGLRSIAVNSKSGPFSVLWLSHDSGAVAFRATSRTRNIYSSLYAEFVQEYASDLHVVQLSSSGRHFEFRESGIILAKYHQAIYSIGESCVEQGYSTICNVERNSGEAEREILVRAHKSGVSYTDTAVSITILTEVKNGDRLSLDIQIPSRCQVRYMSDPNLGVVNLLWVPLHNSAGLLARLNHREEIIGSVRAKVLTFVETQNTNPSKISCRSKAYFEFKEAGRVHINYMTRIIHSCDYVKVALHYVGNSAGSPNSVEIAQQVLGDTDGHWDGITVGASHTVQAGSMCYVTLTCVRGRISEMSYGEWSTLSILWIPL